MATGQSLATLSYHIKLVQVVGTKSMPKAIQNQIYTHGLLLFNDQEIPQIVGTSYHLVA